MVRRKLPSLLRGAYNVIQANAPGAQQRAPVQLGAAALQQHQQQPSHLEQVRGKAQAAATATRSQSIPTLSIPVADIKTDLYGAVSAVNENDVVQEGVFEVGYVAHHSSNLLSAPQVVP
eukprot:1159572-Pelagomonas_calceolata.AAC.10